VGEAFLTALDAKITAEVTKMRRGRRRRRSERNHDGRDSECGVGPSLLPSVLDRNA
jgi:hypothetical protein